MLRNWRHPEPGVGDLSAAPREGLSRRQSSREFRVLIGGQLRRVMRPLRREMKSCAAIEPVMGHLKAEHCMGRNHLRDRDGDRINDGLADAGYSSVV